MPSSIASSRSKIVAPVHADGAQAFGDARRAPRGAAKLGGLLHLGYVGEDDVVGSLAHEIGVVYSVIHPPEGADPYRTAEADTLKVDSDVDLERGSIATVYLGLGVLAANAARQQHAVFEGQGFNPLLVAKVGVQLESGHVPVASLVYLVAVQAAIRGDKQPPNGLVPAQRREVAAWLETLDGARSCGGGWGSPTTRRAANVRP